MDQSSLYIAHGLPDRPVAGSSSVDRCYCVDGVVLDADINAACNVRARLHDAEIMLWMPCREVKALLMERPRTADCSPQP